MKHIAVGIAADETYRLRRTSNLSKLHIHPLVDWERGLTELQGNEYPNRPYRVVRKEKQITVTYYEREENE